MGLYLTSVCVSLFLGVTLSTEADDICLRGPADVVFLLDSSDSIWRSDFDLQLEFVRNVVGEWPVGPGDEDFRVGLVTYSHQVKLEFHLNYYTDRTMLQMAIMRVPYVGGGTYTGNAIQYVYKEMFKERQGGRPAAAHVLVVITDGLSQNTTSTAIQAAMARYYGAKMFVVGVGPGVDQDELESIASNPDNRFLFRVDDFSALDDIKGKLAHSICEPLPNDSPNVVDNNHGDKPDIVIPTKPPENCGGKPAEVFFLIDASSSIWKPDFDKQLAFVKHIIRHFDIGPLKTRVGVIVFSDDVTPVVMLHEVRNDLLRSVDTVPYLTGGTDTAAAVKYMREVGFSKSVARHSVAHVGIILTDGQSQDVKATKQQVSLAHEEGIYLFAIGIGSNVDKKELRDIASDPDDNFVFMLDNFDALTSIQDILAIKTCEVSPMLPPHQDAACFRKTPIDVVFAFDSNEMRTDETEKILDFIQDMVEGMNVGTELTRVGVVTNESPGFHDIGTSQHISKKSFLAELGTMRIPKMADLLLKLRRDSFPRTAKETPHVAVLFVRSRLDKHRQAIREAHRAKRKHIELFVIAIGEGLDPYELDALSSRPVEKHLMTVSSFQQLRSVEHDLQGRLCSVG